MFPSIETAISDCEQHIDKTGVRGTPIEAYLAGFLLIHIYATFDQYVRKLCNDRCAASGDDPVAALALSTLRPRRGEIKISDLGDILSRFDDNIKESFSNSVCGRPCHSAWDNLLTNRHDFAHKPKYPQVTVSDVRRFYADAHDVVREFETAMKNVHPPVSVGS
ncbi:MAG: hypothetical protein AKCLJLPJ_01954 [Fimbriimonadales bacterium]|nr:hypothetical protein [Fimbriimonadales bacterium]